MYAFSRLVRHAAVWGVLAALLAASLTVLGSAPAGAITRSLSVANAAAIEGTGTGGTLKFVITLSATSTTSVSVKYATHNGTAKAPADYTAKSGTAVIGAGKRMTSVSVAIVGDGRNEATETMHLVLTNPTGAVIAHASGIGTIKNDDVVGRDFWMVFPPNYIDPSGNSDEVVISARAGTNVTIATSLPSSQSIAFTTDSSQFISLPTSLEVHENDTVEAKWIHVTASTPISLRGASRGPATMANPSYAAEGFTTFSTPELGARYRILAYAAYSPSLSQLTVLAPYAATTVTITPSVTVGAHAASVPYAISLSQGDAYALQSSSDLTGTLVSGSKPIAVWGGEPCGDVPVGVNYCGELAEQLPPTDTWGSSFVTAPFKHSSTFNDTDVFRFLANTAGTAVSVNGSVVATLAAGEFREQTIHGDATITASHPILVGQYARGADSDGNSDPMMVVLPPTARFRTSYRFAPSIDFVANYLTVIAPSTSVGSVTLDGVAIAGATWTVVGSSAFSETRTALNGASLHVLTGSAALGATVYGYGPYDAYGFVPDPNLQP